MDLVANGQISSPREPLHWKEWAALAAFLIVAVSGFLLMWQVAKLSATVNQLNTEVGKIEQINLRNRAAICDLTKAIGAAEPATCAYENVRPYRDPKIVRDSAQSQ